MRISPTGNNRRGFTLFELIVLLVILACVTAAAIPFFSNLSPRVKILAETHNLLTDLRHARSDALSRKKDVSITFDTAQHFYVFNNQRHNLDVVVEVETKQPSQSYDYTFTFHSDGSATPGKILLFADSYQVNIKIDGLTGQVTRE